MYNYFESLHLQVKIPKNSPKVIAQRRVNQLRGIPEPLFDNDLQLLMPLTTLYIPLEGTVVTSYCK